MFITPTFDQIRDTLINDMKNQLPDADIGTDSDYFVRASSVASVALGIYQHQSWIVRQILSKKNAKSYGYNVQTLEFGDMLEMGILDPVKVTRSALQNAASVAAMILTTECLVTDIPEKEEAPAMGGGGMPGGMGGMM